MITDRDPKDQPRLRQADTSEKFEELRLSHTAYQVLEQGYHWDPGAAKHPDTADPLGDPLNGNEACPPSFWRLQKRRLPIWRPAFRNQTGMLPSLQRHWMILLVPRE